MKERPENKIDPVVALIMALARPPRRYSSRLIPTSQSGPCGEAAAAVIEHLAIAAGLIVVVTDLSVLAWALVTLLAS